MAQIINGYLYEKSKNNYERPIRLCYNPAEWQRSRLLKSFGLLANRGHKFYKRKIFTLGKYSVCFSVFDFWLM